MLRYTAFAVVLIFYITKDFFDNVLKSYHASCTAQFIYDDGDAFLFLHQQAHQLIGEHALRDKHSWYNAIVPILVSKHLTRVDIAYWFVNVVFVDNELTASSLEEFLF